MLVQHSGPQSAECLASSADPGVDLLVEGIVTGNDTAEVSKLLYSLQRCTFDGNGRATGCG